MARMSFKVALGRSAAEALRAYFRTTAFTELSAPMQQSLASLRDGVSRIHAEVE